MKKQLLAILLSGFSLLCLAQSWEVTPAEYEFSMNIIGQVSINGEIADDAVNYVGAFIGDVCVGVCSPIKRQDKYELFFLTVYSNQSSGDNVVFKFVDANATETLISNTVSFFSDGVIGNTKDPFVWFDTEEYASTDILSFSLVEQNSAAVINAEKHTIHISIKQGTSLTNLAPQFTLPPGAEATVNTVEQESGVTSNDYSSDVVYLVTGADASSANWTVTVSVVSSNSVEQLSSDVISVYPNPVYDVITIDMKNSMFEQIKIYDIEGKLVLTRLCEQAYFDMDVSFFEKGIYYLCFIGDKDVFKYKLIKK